MIFHSYKTIYFHIGKAAGTSIENAFDPRERDASIGDRNTLFGYDLEEHIYLQHATPALTKGIVGADIFDEYFKFASVRNPFSRLASVYHYVIDQHEKIYGSFDNFLQSLPSQLANSHNSRGAHILPQSQYCYLDGEPICDLVIRFEALETEFAKVQIKTGLQRSLGHLNQSPAREWNQAPLDELYSDQSAQIIRDTYADDFELFGYSMDPKVLFPIADGTYPLR